MGRCEESSLQKVVVGVWSRQENINGGAHRKEDEQRRKIRAQQHERES